ncbi:putative bifunctional diguanylate cyclase/phosphodiesterase [Mariniluteicoccus flavus]
MRTHQTSQSGAIRRALVFLPALVVAAVLRRLLFADSDPGMAMFWPASGVVTLWAVIARSRRELAFVAVAIAVVLVPVFALDGFTLLGNALIVVTNQMMAIGVRIGLDLLRHRPHRGEALPPPMELRTPRDAYRFVLVVFAVVSVGSVGATLAVVANGQPFHWDTAIGQLFRNFASILAITGTGLVWVTGDERDRPVRWNRVMIVAGFTLVLAGGIFAAGMELPLVLALLLPLFYSGISAPPWLATLHATATAALIVALVQTFGAGPFGATGSGLIMATSVQLFVVVSCILILVVSTAMARSRILAARVVHDPLTGLLNREGFDEAVAARTQRLEEDGEDSALLLVDLDNFKDVNDSHGHLTGDQLLVAIARGLRTAAGPDDLIARLGGDEFAVLVPDTGSAGAAEAAAGLVARVRETTSRLGAEQRRVTASVGAVTLAGARRDGTDPLVLADMLMYDAKESGRNRFALHDPTCGSRPRMGQRLTMQRRLEDALDNGRFELHLQPVLTLDTEVIRGAEAVVRMREGDELLLPNTFMPLAERAGLAPRVDAWVMAEALRLLEQLVALSPGFVLAANVSGPSVSSPDFESLLSDLLDARPPAPGQFVLELTETMVVADMDQARALATCLLRRGVDIALDDFGSGAASFYYLKQLPFSHIKIDGQFITDIVSSPADRAIVRSLVGVARELDKTTLAEHIVDRAALEVVRDLGVDFGQGYGIGRPVPYDEFVRLHLGG